MMIPRRIQTLLQDRLDHVPAVALLGPSQAGKTTRAHAVAEGRKSVYLDLESPLVAVLFVRSLSNLKYLHPGFDASNLMSFSVDPRLNGYGAERAKIFYKQLQSELAAVPGARSAALCLVPPLSFNDWDSDMSIEGYAPKPGEDMSQWVNYVSPGFFSTLKIPTHSGRDFTEKDTLAAPKVVVVNEKFARHYFGSQRAISRHIGFGSDEGTKTDIEIIGVVGDTKYQMMKQDPPRQVFFPYLQQKQASQMTAYVRSDLGPAQMFPMLRSVVRRLDANLPLYQMKTVEHQRDDSVSVERLAASLATAFGVLATVLAAIGLYGVMAFLVARRTREIGIRIALGAITGNVIWLVMREVLLLLGIGIAFGLPVAFAVTRLLASQLYGITPSDPATFILATLGIAIIAALSGYIPARRATRVDPLTALRYE